MNFMSWNLPEVRPLSRELEPALRRAIDQKTKPIGSLGRLEPLALQIGLIQQTLKPEFRAPTELIFAGDHGFAADGVSPFPPEVTPQMVANFLAGGAAISVFSRQHGLTLKVVDAGVATELPAHPDLIAMKVRAGTRNARRERALTAGEVLQCLGRGGEVIARCAERGTNVVLLGEMGIGNTSAAALLHSALLGLPLADCVGRGAGHDDAGLARKLTILQEVRKRHADATTPLDALAAFGGCEIAMLAGAILAAAARRMLIVVDGYIVTSAVLVAASLQPAVRDYCVFAHASAEPGHGRALRELGAEPLIDLGLRLGEGSGAALAWPLVVSAAAFLREMATFESAGVTNRA
ncbi:nicotinate-nucleotide--dimethylbenzimidazole phosphoribosyltransferase [Opitutus sp. ER46]|uniref:nicotinate-nucleotide--dimethylbenzimidazole phosphoribosyltransferase n=1 Tax=Opitutus sp. ER46 TaxID=2161864 RepID=UPI000D3160F2|nr:nicotinate-nucleotide--dimethylbenzimidazole phosphoribosyltransferase [Opitutus sp. ER46]PTX92390.1 nicotinate-nucleotide--dimethylbenzimidazole phosphoribosyltransferase [Opitutus sp. ER46]